VKNRAGCTADAFYMTAIVLAAALVYVQMYDFHLIAFPRQLFFGPTQNTG
jgi:hypothetical protein